MSKRIINNNYHFGKHVVKFKSLSKCHVVSKKDYKKNIIFYDILDDLNTPLVRVQCSSKYIIVLFIENKNGYIYNKKTDTKDTFSFDEFGIDDFANKKILSYWTFFRISEYNREGIKYHFNYNKSGELVSVLENKMEDQMVDLTTYEDVSEKDIPIRVIEGIFMRQGGGIVYAEKIA